MSYTEDYGNHPNLFDRLMRGREVGVHDVPMQHEWRYSNELRQGDGIFNEGRSWVVKAVNSHDKGVTAVVEPRAGAVGRSVISQMQFGVQGLTLEDTEEKAFTFPHGKVLPVRL